MFQRYVLKSKWLLAALFILGLIVLEGRGGLFDQSASARTPTSVPSQR